MAKFMWQMGDEALAKVTVSLSLLDYCNSLSLSVLLILLRRQQMAKFMWQMGDEALAKVTVSLCLP